MQSVALWLSVISLMRFDNINVVTTVLNSPTNKRLLHYARNPPKRKATVFCGFPINYFFLNSGSSFEQRKAPIPIKIRAIKNVMPGTSLKITRDKRVPIKGAKA